VVERVLLVVQVVVPLRAVLLVELVYLAAVVVDQIIVTTIKVVLVATEY
jgi:hypothetical protein